MINSIYLQTLIRLLKSKMSNHRDQSNLSNLLSHLILTWENEVVEFKRGGSGFSTQEIAKYFSALSNEANLREKESGWLVFGVAPTRKIEGTDYRTGDQLQELKYQISKMIEPSVTFRNIYEHQTDHGRVILFEIPSCPMGMPVSYNGHYYARAGESVSALGLNKLDEIRKGVQALDWTAQLVSDATINHLDHIAIRRSKEAFAKKYANRFSESEVMGWSDITFLDRAKLTKEGQITRATLLILGKSEASHFLSPHPAQLTWKLEGYEKAYHHFGPPFILSTSNLYQKIRNIQLRILPMDELFPIEVSKYDQKILLEALHNCIAHQDYSRHARIIVTEYPDRLIFENEGSFFEGSPMDYISGNKTPKRYRNPFLTQAMVELNMIDTMGYGIHEMYIGQARRYFPMPDYDLTEKNTVKMTLYGDIVDPAYSRLLIQKTDLSMDDIFVLDRIQKKLPIDPNKIKYLRKKNLIEGRKPNFYVSASIASATATRAEYIRTRTQDDEFYTKLVKDYLSQFGHATRIEIDNLLWPKLSDGLNDSQKRNKINNLISKMRLKGEIQNSGSDRKPIWRLLK